MRKLLIATTNKAKFEEMRAILKDSHFQFLSLKDINFSEIEPEEIGETFEENAVIKAKFYGRKTGLLTLADDSGLEIATLPQKLGVKTKRYANGTDKDRYKTLLREMKDLSKLQRRAEFISVVALFDPETKKTKTTKGICHGWIGYKAKGTAGFGYDPVFVVSKLGKHFAELTLKEKNKFSHRARALEKMRVFLKPLEKEI